MRGGLIGEPREVALPPLAEAYWTSDHTTFVPRYMNADLAELVGYFMGDGSLHAKGLRFCVDSKDSDVIDRLVELGRRLFGLEASVTARAGYIEVAYHSVRLTLWWEACGFAKHAPTTDHRGKGYEAHIPDAVLHTNDPESYRAFVRGLFEADGNTNHDYASWSTVNRAVQPGCPGAAAGPRLRDQSQDRCAHSRPLRQQPHPCAAPAECQRRRTVRARGGLHLRAQAERPPDGHSPTGGSVRLRARQPRNGGSPRSGQRPPAQDDAAGAFPDRPGRAGARRRSCWNEPAMRSSGRRWATSTTRSPARSWALSS